MKRLSVLIALAAAALPLPATAWDEGVDIAPDARTAWIEDQLAVVRNAGASRARRFDLADANVWARGLDNRKQLLPVAPPPDKAMGAKLRPFKGYDFLIGTELSRLPDANQPLRSELNWQASWTRDWGAVDGVSVGLRTAGLVESLHGGLSQNFAGSLRIRLLSDKKWVTQVQISPQVSFDSLSGAWRPSLVPELVSETVLNAPSAPLRSLLRFKLGYDLAPNARPSAAAMLELRLQPRI